MKRILSSRLLALRNTAAADAVRWTNTVLVTAIGISLAQLTWRLIPTPVALDAPPNLSASPTTPAAAHKQRIDTVAALHLFGQEVTAGNQIQAPETHLDFTLHGLFASDVPSDSFAIIANGGNIEHTYRIGDKLGGATIHNILPNRVILEHAGHYETLKLPKFHLAVAAIPGNTATGITPELNPGVKRQLNELRRNILSNPQKLFDLATFDPVFSNGQLLGYRIIPRAHIGLFRAAGLTPRDIITEVNGMPVTDPSQLGAITAQLSNASALQIGIERPDGSHDELTLNLN